MNILKTAKTYATSANATLALLNACKKIGKDIVDVRFLIAVNEYGRFAPVVVGHDDAKGWTNNDFIFQSITWVG
jgi:hypothetical protein